MPDESPCGAAGRWGGATRAVGAGRREDNAQVDDNARPVTARPDGSSVGTTDDGFLTALSRRYCGLRMSVDEPS